MKLKLRITKSIIPNLLTLGNLFSGFSAIIYISKNEFEIAAGMLLVAGIFDLLDGIVARLIRATSEIGIQLDSLCDAVSFGVVPSYFLYTVYFHSLGEIGIVISSLPALGGVYRLARFNVHATLEDKNYFTGMPIPAAAIYIMSFIVFHYLDPNLSENLKTIGIFIVVFSAPLLMISIIKFDNLPRPSWKSIKVHPWNFGITIFGIIVIIASLGKLLFPMMLFYIILNVLRALFNIGKNTPGRRISGSKETSKLKNQKI